MKKIIFLFILLGFLHINSQVIPSDNLRKVDNAVVSTHDIRYNQVGYFTGRDKVISITAANVFTAISYTITNSSGTTVMTGTAGPSVNYTSANLAVDQIDITSINTPDTYTITTSENSATFTVSDQPYEDLSKAALRYYYFNRASTPIIATHGGQWARPSGTPDTNVRIHSSAISAGRPAGFIISSPGGWYDAGDYNKYIVNSGISTYTVLAAYEHFSTFQTNKDVNIPESGDTMPDVLDEAAYNIDWMLTMQDPADGGVYHKLTGLNFSGRIMPANYNLQRYVVQKSTAATLNFAAVMAQASRIYAAFPNEKPGYSTTLRQAAISAYNWAKTNNNVAYNQPNDVNTGQYGDGTFNDEFFWAAVELYLTTGLTTYSNDINLNIVNGNVPAWPSVGSLGLYSLMENSNVVGSQINMNLVASKITIQANQITSRINNSTMQNGMGNQDFVWGSNSNSANQIMMLLIAYKYTNNSSYLDAAYIGTDYLLGRNPTGYCFVTGFGDQRIMQPHHRISDADGIIDPVPGMLAGGPHSGQQDGCSYPSNSPATSYIDDWCSYSTNEVTINWNAPLFYLTSALEYYQEQDLLSTEDVLEDRITLKLFPNPTKNIFTYELSQDIEVHSLEMYNIEGQQIHNFKSDIKKHFIDISQLSNGMYFLKLNAGNLHFTRKMIKK